MIARALATTLAAAFALGCPTAPSERIYINLRTQDCPYVYPLVAVDRSALIDELGEEGTSGSFRSRWLIGGSSGQIAHPVGSGISISRG